MSRLVRCAKGVFTSTGLDFFEERLQQSQDEDIACIAAQYHAGPLGVTYNEIEQGYWEYWANWHPGNRRDNWAYMVDSIKVLFQDSFKPGRLTGRGLALYLAAIGRFRCSYTQVPLIPLIKSAGQPIYAWYPVIEHINAICKDPERHQLSNLCIAGFQVNDLFGSLRKETCMKLMQGVLAGHLVDAGLIQQVGRESLQNSGRER